MSSTTSVARATAIEHADRRPSVSAACSFSGGANVVLVCQRPRNFFGEEVAAA